MKTTTLITAVTKKEYGAATGIFSGIMAEKVQAALSDLRKKLTEEDDKEQVQEGNDKCTHCGSTKDLADVDGTKICAECDPER